MSKGSRRVVLFLALIGASLACLNWLTFRQAKRYYLQLNDVRLDPLGLTTYASDPDPPADRDRTTVVFYGDSRAEQWPFPELAGVVFVNRGIGAQTSAQVAERFDDHVRPLRPQIVVVQVGINDLKMVPFYPERRGEITARCLVHIRQIVHQATEAGAMVVLTTVFPTGRVPLYRIPFWSGEVSLAVNEVNAGIRSLAGPDVIVIDAFDILADQKGSIRAAYGRDLLHLTAAGYEVLNEALVHTLESMDLGRVTG
jgi:lysophospholipase L1-like esterase